MPHFNQPNIVRKSCVGTTTYKRLMELCIVHHVEMKSVFTFQPRKRLVFTSVRSVKPAATFKDQKPTITLFGGDGTHCFAKKPTSTTKKKSHLHFWRYFSANNHQARPNLIQKGQNLFHLWPNRVDTPLVDTVNQNFIYNLTLYPFSLHWSNMIFSVSNDGIEWSLDFGPDSATLTVDDLVQEMTISSQEFPPAAWSLLLSQRQQFLNNHLARVSVTPNLQVHKKA